jgi:5'-nucleotidase
VSSTTNGAGRVLRVLVTNDDGVHAPGIDALVQALRAVPQVSVTVVAPATNQSGTAEKTTGGKLTVDSTTTASGYPATAVHGYPADTIVWAIDDHGVAQRPDVVLSGVNNGQNIGFAVDLSGTVGAARAAAQRGIPALAVSAGIGAHPDFAGAASAAIGWLGRARAGLLVPVPAGGHRAADVTNINVPTCPRGSPRPLVVVPVAPKSANAFARVDCVSPAGKPVNDVDGFVHGYIVESNEVALHPPAST